MFVKMKIDMRKPTSVFLVEVLELLEDPMMERFERLMLREDSARMSRIMMLDPCYEYYTFTAKVVETAVVTARGIWMDLIRFKIEFDTANPDVVKLMEK